MLCSGKITRHSVILLLEHHHRNRCSMIENCTGNIASVTTNRSGKNCRRTGSYTFRFEGPNVCGGGKALSAGVAQPVPTTSSLATVKDAPRRCDPLCRLLPARSASPPGGLLLQRARQVKAAQEDERKGRGRARLGLDAVLHW